MSKTVVLLVLLVPIIAVLCDTTPRRDAEVIITLHYNEMIAMNNIGSRIVN
jgi:hypothetical protein